MDYTYTIIDSCASSNLQLRTFLEEYADFECVAKASEPESGLNDILKYTPDIVFIHLNEESSKLFSMVRDIYQFINTLPLIIGISNSKHHAYEAIKNGFFDYWLQPYNEFEIRKTLLKLKKQMPKEVVPKTLCLQSYKDFNYLNTNDILYLKADNNTTEFFMKDGTITNAFKTLKTFEKTLPNNFIRIHQSYIVNSSHVSRINFGKSICALKQINQPLPFSKTYRSNMEDIKDILSKNTVSSIN